MHCIVFPPLDHFPGFSDLAAKDLRGYVSAGNNVVFVGSYEYLSIMNDVFGFQLMSGYADGPYYRNDRTVRGTPFQWSMARLEQPDGSVYGVKVLPRPLASWSRVPAACDGAVRSLRLRAPRAG